MVRGTGKFKQKRGGGHSFSKHMVLDENGVAVSTDRRWASRDKTQDASDEDEDEEDEAEDEEEEESEEEPGPAANSSSAQPEMTRAERRELKKKKTAKKEEDDEEEDEDLINPNHVEKTLKISDLGAPRELSRREREQKEKQEAKERYWKLHVQGKTDEAKTDLARLAKIRADREAAQAKRKAEAEAKIAEIEAKNQVQHQKKTKKKL